MDGIHSLGELSSQMILDSLNDGVYVTDLERRIVFWSQGAQRITGWAAPDMLGRTCFDDKLCHTDKDNNPLCGKEACPLHRSIVTGEASTVPLIVFARGADGQRIPMQVSVAPIRNNDGLIVGGVETFRDMSIAMGDLERARRIQAASMAVNLPSDWPLTVTAHYQPNDIVGGDIFIIERLEAGRTAFLLADLMGHGISAALYSTQLHALWTSHRNRLNDLPAFTNILNRRLYELVCGEHAFASAVFGIHDPATQELTLVGAGSPPFFIFHPDGEAEIVQTNGLSLGLLDEDTHTANVRRLVPGDILFLFTDGATEIFDRKERPLTDAGLLDLLHRLDYPASQIPLSSIAEELLKYCGGIRFDDDLTLLEIRIR